MLVSILLPAFNAATTLLATLHTVYAQDWPDWELLIVDDASTDDTRHLAAAAAAGRPSQIRLLVNDRNEGAGPTRNRALAASRGTFVASLDADDLWDAGKLRRQVTTLLVHPTAALTWGPGWFSDAAGEPTHLQPLPLPEWPLLLEPPGLVALMLGGVFPFTSSLLLRREAMLAVGGYERLRRGQDMSLLYKLATHYPTLYHPQPLCRYRLHEGSSTSRTARDLVQAQRDDTYYRWVAAYLAQHEVVRCFVPRAEQIIAAHQPLVAAERALRQRTHEQAR